MGSKKKSVKKKTKTMKKSKAKKKAVKKVAPPAQLEPDVTATGSENDEADLAEEASYDEDTCA